jgi:hypothetical protein
MGSRTYDTLEGIGVYLKDLKGFHGLVEARKKAKERGEELKSFYVLRKFTLDKFAQVDKLIGFESLPEEIKKDFPDIVTASKVEEEFRSNPNLNLQILITPVYIPKYKQRCAHCKKEYDISDFDDVYVTKKEEKVLLDRFVGRQLWEVKRHFGMIEESENYLDSFLTIQNNRFIDDRIGSYGIKLNENGWVGLQDNHNEQGEISDWYMIQAGDSTILRTIYYRHKECHAKYMKESTLKDIKLVLDKANLSSCKISETENKYGSFDYSGPWHEVTTEYGVFTIGKRKKVILITLHDWGIDLSKVFKMEDVTKDKNMIHAWGYEKASEYLQKIFEEMSKK